MDLHVGARPSGRNGREGGARLRVDAGPGPCKAISLESRAGIPGHGSHRRSGTVGRLGYLNTDCTMLRVRRETALVPPR